ncbi:N-lysine methyltransferase setd6 [Chytriomyces hyalinus]|nr:N-lysine methyltransferase setd6 [Chytriomyces hyalinus]
MTAPTKQSASTKLTKPTNTKAFPWTLLAAFADVCAAFAYARMGSTRVDPQSERFLAWMAQRGIVHTGTHLVYLESDNRDVYTHKDFEEGDMLMIVPHQAVSYTDHWVPIIASFILLHRNDPMWKSYLDFLPKTFSTPMYWNIEKEWDHWKSYLPAYSTLIEFTWAWHCVMSRVWTLPVGEGKNEAVMIPMVDVANHFGKPKVKIEYNSKLGAVTMTATQSIKSGEQVDVTYGEMSNYKSLKYMGFTMPDNDHNEDCRVRIFRESEDPPSYRIPRRWCLFQIKRLNRSVQECHLGQPNDPNVLERIAKAARAKLRTYPTTVKQDDDILETAAREQLSFDYLNAVRARRGEKTCLQKIARIANGAVQK